MITGVHAIVYTKDADALRAFFRDVLELPNVDSGGGWLIFALPPAEMGIHPGDNASHELYFMCDDLDATVRQLKAKGVRFQGAVSEERWGRMATFEVPGGGKMSLYQPKHPTALGLK